MDRFKQGIVVKKGILLMVCVFQLAVSMVAQNISFPQDKGITITNITPMMIENDLLGYFACTSLGYAKSEYVYNLVVMDINFKITKDKLISSTMPMKQIVFNGSHFCMVFQATKYVIYAIYDTEGVLAGEKRIDYKDPYQSASEALQTLAPVPYKGFIRLGMQYGWDSYLEMFDHTGDVIWKIDPEFYTGTTAGKVREVLNVIKANEQFLVVGVTLAAVTGSDAKTRTRDFQRVYDAQSGATLFEINATAGNGLRLHGVVLEPDAISVYGAYFPGGKVGVLSNEQWGGEKAGIYLQTYDASGKMKYEYINDGERDMQSLLGKIKEAEYNEDACMWIHNLVKSGERYYLIGEMYSDKSKTVRNMIALEFDTAQAKPIAYVFQKDIPEFGSRAGLVAFQYYNLGYNLMKLGHFGYKFTSQNKDHSMFAGIYTNLDNTVKGDEKTIVGAIALDRDGQVVNPKIILATKPDDVFVYPGKPGYVAVAEYFKKEKKVTLTLHKFDF